jgi:phosphatidylglycerophosphate synthase
MGTAGAAMTRSSPAATCASVTAAGAATLLACSSAWATLADVDRALLFFVGALATWTWLSSRLWRHRHDDCPQNPQRVPHLPRSFDVFVLGAATRVTLLRGLLVSVVGGFVLLPPAHGVQGWVVALVYTAACLLDGVDGAVARRRRQLTRLGAELDVATDVVGLLVAPLVAVKAGRLPPWYLLLALAYPALQMALAVRQRRGRPVHRERLRPDPRARFFAGVQMVVVCHALYPVLPAWLLWPAATAAMLPTLALFAGEWRLATRT